MEFVITISQMNHRKTVFERNVKNLMGLLCFISMLALLISEADGYIDSLDYDHGDRSAFSELCERTDEISRATDVPYSIRRWRDNPEATMHSPLGIHTKDRMQLYCEYLSGYVSKNEFEKYQSVLGRYKVEHLSFKPVAMIFHDLLTEEEIRELKEESLPSVSLLNCF